jgi:hypothetical protein
MSGPLLFAGSEPEIEESDGLFQLTFTSGELSTTYVLTLHTLSRHVRSCKRALDGFHKRQSANITSFEPRGKTSD